MDHRSVSWYRTVCSASNYSTTFCNTCFWDGVHR